MSPGAPDASQASVLGRFWSFMIERMNVFCGKRWREEMSSCATVVDIILARRFLFYGPILWKGLSEVIGADLVVLCV